MRLTRRYLVDINCLFDDRLGLVKAIQPEALERLEEKAYRKRHTEAWAAVIGIEDWHAKYAKRDKRALQNAEPTEFLEVLATRLEGELITIEMSSPIEKPTLTINLWPYSDLTEEERHAFLVMFRRYYDMVKVDVICTPILSLTPGRLRAAWDAWFVYDWFPWIKANAPHFANQRIPNFVITTPAILSEDITEETVAWMKRDRANPFVERTRFMAELVTVDTVDAALLSRRALPPPADADS